MSASPSKKGVQRLKTKVSNLLVSGNNDSWPEVRDALNRSLLTSATERVDRPSVVLTDTSIRSWCRAKGLDVVVESSKQVPLPAAIAGPSSSR